MSRPCEVCDGLSTASGALVTSSGGRRRRVLVGDRILVLCDEHAAETRMHDVASVEELSAIFREPAGKRALVARRAVLDRRIFPPRPEGRRASDGRRAKDSD